jgi:hypothetical protein
MDPVEVLFRELKLAAHRLPYSCLQLDHQPAVYSHAPDSSLGRGNHSIDKQLTVKWTRKSENYSKIKNKMQHIL